ncbi:MAG: hypothetical protein A3F70_14870 [Acidobacteria bacterium RIFCSPLOWO2_12_FULL_67_14]|nr:MAG: hypothetical protein A3H29_08790 [Acidobacteria bacterium RIFCSPLOWO2_02_FULL_67_21]OFW37514.1 MAG: hypothetical protein A3F70_14870 [Acidobacteria bacterium RIFCSPLOWO2_12_FULL_67_14]
MTASHRVLVWTSSYRPRPGGLSVLVTNLVSALERLGVSVAVLTDSWSSEPAYEAHGKIDVLRLPFLDALSSREPQRILDLLQRARDFAVGFRPNLIHLHGLGADTVLFDLLLRRIPLPLVLTRHEHFPEDAHLDESSTSRRILQSARFVVVPTRALANDIRRVAPDIPEERLEVVPNGIPEPDRDAPPLSIEPLRFLYLGRLVPQKGVDVALHAFARFQRSYGNCRFKIVGDGPERPALQELVRSLDVDNVEFAGAVAPERVWQELVDSSVLLVPSRLAEGFGLVAAEAALARRTVIASRVSGLDEVVLDGITGLLVPPDSPAELETVMHRVARDLEFAFGLAERAHTRAKRLYALDGCAEKYYEVYEKVLRGNP